MYQKIIKKIIELGDSLPALSGDAVNIGEAKQHLTDKDIEIENQLTKTINTFPGEHLIYAEELHDDFVAGDNVWVIDPISNTMNFIHGLPHYSIVLSHLHKGELKFAVVYDPSNKELFTAEKGKGSFLNSKKINVSKRKTDLFFLMSGIHGRKELQIIGLISELGNVRIFGSYGLHYAYVACGRADAAISFNKDTFPEFAGKLILEEAGGKLTDFKGGVLHAETSGILASNGLVHQKTQDLICSVIYIEDKHED